MKRAGNQEEHVSNERETGGDRGQSKQRVLMLEWNVNLYPQICFFSGETKNLDLL